MTKPLPNSMNMVDEDEIIQISSDEDEEVMNEANNTTWISKLSKRSMNNRNSLLIPVDIARDFFMTDQKVISIEDKERRIHECNFSATIRNPAERNIGGHGWYNFFKENNLRKRVTM